MLVVAVALGLATLVSFANPSMIIIGGGPAGLTTSIYAARENLETTSEPVENRISSHAAIAGRLAQAIKTTEQRYERDRDTATLVFKRIDPTSGEVIMQLPTQSVLDLRAYLKQQETSGQAETALSKTA